MLPLPSLPIILIACVFLLLPVAHLRLFDARPLYIAEIPLLFVASLVLMHKALLQKLWMLLREEYWLFIGSFGFVAGVSLTFLINALPFHSLGLVKSFVVLPLLLTWSLLLLVKSTTEARFIVKFWWFGLVMSALVGLLFFFNGQLTYDGRLAAWYSSPNEFAMLLAPGALLGLWLTQTSVSRQRWWYFLGTLTITLALCLTRSYAVLGSAIITSLWLLTPVIKRLTRRQKFASLLLGAMLGMSLLILEGGTDKFQSLIAFDERSSFTSRLMIWEAALKISQDTFPWGIGIGHFQSMYLEYQVYFPSYLEWAVPEPHNLVLSLFLAAGLLGFLSFAWVMGIALYRLWSLRITQNNEISTGARLYLGLFGLLLLIGLVDTPYFKNDLTLVWWGLLGLSLTLFRQVKKSRG